MRGLFFFIVFAIVAVNFLKEIIKNAKTGPVDTPIGPGRKFSAPKTSALHAVEARPEPVPLATPRLEPISPHPDPLPDPERETGTDWREAWIHKEILSRPKALRAKGGRD